MKVLVIDDEVKILDVVKSYLEHDGYEVYTATNGREAFVLFQEVNPSLIILDLMLPDISGEIFCNQIRQTSRVPIIMLTAKADEESILNGLDMGADDYVTKPFSPKQLVARVSAVLRRTAHEEAMRDFVINSSTRIVTMRGEQINLTPNEFKIIHLLAQYPNRVFTRDDLIHNIFGEDFDGFDRTIDTHIKNIRKKIEADSRNPKYILTVHGVGYKFGGE